MSYSGHNKSKYFWKLWKSKTVHPTTFIATDGPIPGHLSIWVVVTVSTKINISILMFWIDQGEIFYFMGHVELWMMLFFQCFVYMSKT